MNILVKFLNFRTFEVRTGKQIGSQNIEYFHQRIHILTSYLDCESEQERLLCSNIGAMKRINWRKNFGNILTAN